MERDIGKLIKIPGELTSAAIDHKVAAAEDIYDYNQSEYQSIINMRIQNQINELDEFADPDAIPFEFINIICI